MLNIILQTWLSPWSKPKGKTKRRMIHTISSHSRVYSTRVTTVIRRKGERHSSIKVVVHQTIYICYNSFQNSHVGVIHSNALKPRYLRTSLLIRSDIIKPDTKQHNKVCESYLSLSNSIHTMAYPEGNQYTKIRFSWHILTFIISSP